MPELNTNQKRKRRIMREFTLKEISSVDRPAQEGAKAVIMKRMEEPVQKLIRPPTSESFNAAVATIRARDACTGTEALRKARVEQPALFDCFQKGETARVEKSATSDAVVAFNKRISEIAGRDSCLRTEAMQRAREEYPTEFLAYQSVT